MSSVALDQPPQLSRREARSAPLARSWLIGAIATLALGILPAVLWPGAVSWQCDEPVLVGQACYYNQAHQLAPRGLGGTLLVAYGPLATQFYQLVLHFTHDLCAIVVIHAFLLSALMAGSLLWLSRTLRLTPWYAAAIVCAPYLWWSVRVLWDADFVLPIGLLGMAAYAAHLRKPSAMCLAIATGGLALAPLIHLQALPLFAAFALHAIWNFRRQWRRWFGVPVALAVILAPNLQYIHDTVQFVYPRLHTIFGAGYGPRAEQKPLWVCLGGPFLGGCLFDGATFEAERNRINAPPIVRESALRLSQIATPLIGMGIIVGAVGVLSRRKFRSPAGARCTGITPAIVGSALADADIACSNEAGALVGSAQSLRIYLVTWVSNPCWMRRIVRNRRFPNFLRREHGLETRATNQLSSSQRTNEANGPQCGPYKSCPAPSAPSTGAREQEPRPLRRTLRDHAPAITCARRQLSAIALCALFLQILLAGSLHVPALPQYFFGTFPIHVLFGWLAVDFLQRYRLGLPVAALWGGSLAFTTLGTAWQVHRGGWNRWLMSPSLENQIEIATRLNDYTDESALTDVRGYRAYPAAIRELRVILPPAPGTSRHRSPHGLIIRYTADPDPSSKIELIERTNEPPDPAKFKELDITPMPKAY